MRQWADANHRLEAIHAADALLATWLDTPSAPVPAPSEGTLNGTPGYTWRTSLLRDPAAATLGAVIVRMEVFEPASSRAERPPIFAVDFLRHVYPRRNPSAAAPVDRKSPGVTR